MLFKWVLIVVLQTNCSPANCADGIAVAQIPMESRELCIEQSKYVSEAFNKDDPLNRKVRMVCIQNAYPIKK